MKNSTIQWYPGHIAKAERQISQNLERVDLIIEVRDARIPLATSHPCLKKWHQKKKHLLVINRKDMITPAAIKEWDNHLRMGGDIPWWCDAKSGTGVHQLRQAAIRAGKELNSRRTSRGMKHRAVRALTLGFPNVGKSALINRLVKKKVVSSSRKAGVTRALRWVRLGEELDLLDAPGVLPPRLDDQIAALKLAICDDIGQASYDIEGVAIFFIKLIQQLKTNNSTGLKPRLLEKRYGVSIYDTSIDPNEWLKLVAKEHTSGNTRRMAQRLIDDFRKKLLGDIALEVP